MQILITGNASSDESTKTHEKTEVLHYHIAHITAKGGNKNALKRFNQYYNRVETKYQKYIHTVLYPHACQTLKNSLDQFQRFHPFKAKLSYQITENSDDFLSVLAEITETTDLGRRYTRYCCVWNPQTGYPLALRDILGKHWRKSLRNTAFEEATHRESLHSIQYYNNFYHNFFHIFHPDHFYIQNGQIIIFFPPATIAPESDGTQEFFYRFSK